MKDPLVQVTEWMVANGFHIPSGDYTLEELLHLASSQLEKMMLMMNSVFREMNLLAAAHGLPQRIAIPGERPQAP